MARQRNPKRDEARSLWEADRDRPLKDIADELGITSSTVRKWKSQDNWEQLTTTESPPKKRKSKGSAPIEKERSLSLEEAIEEVDDSELTDKQKAFVIEYVRTFNATQAYMNVYGVEYDTARSKGSRLVAKGNVQAEIKRVRSARLQELGANKNDVLADLMKQAFSDLGDYVEFGATNQYATKTVFKGGKQEEENILDVNGEPIVLHQSWVQLKDKSVVDTSLIKKVSIGRDGVVLDLYDKQKAQERLLAEISKSQQAELESARMRRVIADAIIAEAKAAAIQTTGAEQERQDEQIDRLLAGIETIAQEERRKADEENG